MRLLFIGDIFGKPGRQAVTGHLPRLRRSLSPDVIVANGENVAGGAGLTVETCRDLFALGVDVITTGNHVWDRKEIVHFIPDEPRLLRPLNYPADTPGRGWIVLEEHDLLVMNLQGRVFMRPLDDPFRSLDAVLTANPTRFCFLDFHAEATAEKKAMGYFLDGRVSAVVGTHTHVQTADEQILPKGTGFITDVGMTGPVDSIIGNDPSETLERYLSFMYVRSGPAAGRSELNGVVLDFDDATGLTTGIKRVREPWPI